MANTFPSFQEWRKQKGFTTTQPTTGGFPSFEEWKKNKGIKTTTSTPEFIPPSIPPNQFIESIIAGFNPAYTPKLQAPSNLLDRIIRGGGQAIGALPQYIAGSAIGQAAVPIPFLGAALGMGGVGAARETYRQAVTGPSGIEAPKEIGKAGLLDALLGAVLHGTAKLPLPLRVPATGAIGAGTAAATGAEPEDIASQGILMSLLSLVGGRKAKPKVTEPVIPQTPEIAQPKTTIPKPAGYYGAQYQKGIIEGKIPVGETLTNINELKSFRNNLTTTRDRLIQINKNYTLFEKTIPNLMKATDIKSLLRETNKDIKNVETQIKNLGGTVEEKIVTTPTNQELAIKYLEKTRGKAKMGMFEEVPTEQEVTMQSLKRYREQPKVTIPKPQEITQDLTQPILDKLVRTPKETTGLKKKVEDLSRLNPYQFETGKLETRGPVGKEIVTRGRRATNTAILTVGELKKQIRTTGVDKLTPQEQVSWRAALEGKAQPMNERVGQLVTAWRQIFNKYGAETEVPMIENYFPRRLNETGQKFYENLKQKDMLVEEVMKQQGMDKINAIKYVNKSLRRGSFEFERLLQELPDEYRQTPIQELYEWATEVSRRKGLIQNFGKKNEVVNNLLAEIGRGDKAELKIKQQAQTYVNRIIGKEFSYSDLDPVYNILRQGMVISKLNPLTTIANELQGQINSYLDYGVKGLADATFGKGGNKIIEELGIKDLKGKFGEDIQPHSWATRWMKTIGMEQSEIRGFGRSAQSTYGAINRAFEQLRKDPTNVQAKRLLNNHAMYLDDVTLARDLLSGKMSDFEMKIGLVEGIRKKMFFLTPGERPIWANTGAGATAYTFKSYLLNQLQLLAKAPPHRILAYMMVIAPLTGLPLMMLRKAIQGKPMPENLVDWYTESITAGPGTPFDIVKSLQINPVSFGLGAFSPLVDIATSRNKLKSATSNLPLQSWYLNRLFPPKR